MVNADTKGVPAAGPSVANHCRFVGLATGVWRAARGQQDDSDVVRCGQPPEDSANKGARDTTRALLKFNSTLGDHTE
jgi:hypothetical protein